MDTAQRASRIQRYVVTAEQMQAIESRVFDAGMPVAALMDKVGGLIARWIMTHYPLTSFQRVGILVGPGHNGGDALVVARELHDQGYEVIRHQPFSKQKELTAAHSAYADHLAIPQKEQVDGLTECDVIVDGLFGFGLTRPLEGAIAQVVDQVNAWNCPVVSIDLPSGLDTDTGRILGTAIRATHTLCLGLWKRSLLHDPVLDCIGTAELIDFGLPLIDIEAVLGSSPVCQRITSETALAALPLPRPKATYKYKEGHLLLVCGSGVYMGAAILTSLAARASGVGMLSIAVPESLKSMVVAQVPDALVTGCPEQDQGAIARLPDSLQLDRFSAIACGPGLTQDAAPIFKHLLDCGCPLVLDADGLNILANLGTIPTLTSRTATTILTPHPGEFKRLFPGVAAETGDRLSAAQRAAQRSQSTVVFKGAKTVVAHPDGTVWVNPDSTAALARGGSGDVLTGLMGGLVAQASAREVDIHASVQSAVWWHAQAAIAAAQHNTELGVDASALIRMLTPTLRSFW